MRYLLIGTGNITKTYIQAIEDIADSSIVGCISRTGKRPEQMQNIPAWTQIEDVNQEYDAIIITTPNGTHHKYAIKAAQLGKHVLTEKPIDIHLDAIDTMISACKKHNVKLAVAFQRRITPDNREIKKLLETKQLGRVFSVNLQCFFWRNQAYYDSASYRGGYAVDGGGPFIQQAIHNIDTYQWMFGMPLKVKSFLGRFLHDIEAEDHGATILKHEDGMISTITASTCTSPGFPARMEVYTDKGYFITQNDSIIKWNIKGIANPTKTLFSMADLGGNTPQLNNYDRHKLILLDFEEAVSKDKAPFVTGESARKSTELVLKIYGDDNLED
ncbi:Gfo/Idh/MocA family protein [Spirochaeta cellobiosiphila]|uniref:Gfo/Idh/MocA family protein n=1 Tax=Spirochaeta cellobiosiphila TaxID=504483 RepID=UPI0003FA07FF|nr:Gfo/Idh/MocA family oxidoreductase [Spirochaeta cellobiosiphila]